MQWNYGQISRVRGGKSDNIYNVHIKDNELMCNDLHIVVQEIKLI